MLEDGELRVTRVPESTSGPSAGPFVSPSAAGLVAEAITTAAVPAELGALVADAFTRSPADLLQRMREHIDILATEEAYEAAAWLRDRASVLSRTLGRQLRAEAMRRAGRLVIEVENGTRAQFARGVLAATWDPAGHEGSALASVGQSPVPPTTGPLPTRLADEMAVTTKWLAEHLGEIRVLDSEAPFVWPALELPSFTPGASALEGPSPRPTP